MTLENKTDLEKFKELLDSFGVFWHECKTDGVPPSTLITLSSDYNYGCHFCDEKVHTPIDHKVNSYPGYYTYYSFDADGKFEMIGIYE